MKIKVMKKWVKALRSGKYKQGGGTLKQFNSNGIAQHCCLGVLCELYNDEMRKNKKKILPEKVDYNSYYRDGYCRFDGHEGDLPKKVMKWAGLKTQYGGYSSHQNSLTDWNDNGHSFNKISNIIEKRWESL